MVEDFNKITDNLKFDNIFTASEKKLLRDSTSTIQGNRDAFATQLHIYEKMRSVLECKTLQNAQGRLSKERIALIQAYLFTDTNEIDGILGKRTFAKIQEHLWQEDRDSKRNNYQLSKENYLSEFETCRDFRQYNVGNCWLLATISGLMNYPNYEWLIRTSVSSDRKGGFFITLPLGSPENKWNKYHITAEALNRKQIGITGYAKELAIARWNGITALMLAYWQHATWKTDFNIADLSWGFSSIALNTLVWNMKVYDWDRKMKTQYNVFKDQNQKELYEWNDPEFEDRNLLKAFMQFDKKDSVMMVYANVDTSSGRSDSILPVNKKTQDGKRYEHNYHAFTVYDVKCIKGKTEPETVTLINPWRNNEKFDISYSVFKKLCTGFALWSMSEKISLQKQERNEKWQGRISSNVRSHDAGNKAAIQEATTIGEIIQMTQVVNNDLRLSRWDVIVRQEENSSVRLTSWWQEGSYDPYKVLKFQPNIEFGINFTINWEQLNFSRDVFSDKYNGKQDDRYRLHLYPQRLLVFTERMVHNYVNQNLGENKAPFHLNSSGKITFDVNTKKLPMWAARASQWIQSFWDGLDILKDWSILGINQNDRKTQTDVVNYLNRLYATKNK